VPPQLAAAGDAPAADSIAAAYVLLDGWLSTAQQQFKAACGRLWLTARVTLLHGLRNVQRAIEHISVVGATGNNDRLSSDNWRLLTQLK